MEGKGREYRCCVFVVELVMNVKQCLLEFHVMFCVYPDQCNEDNCEEKVVRSMWSCVVLGKCKYKVEKPYGVLL